MAEDFIFELEDIHYSYMGKYPALCGVTIQVRKGEKIGIIGPNGTGKSTLLGLMDGLMFPDRGSIKFMGLSLTEKNLNNTVFSGNFRRKVGFVFQNPDIQLFCPTVREDIVFGPLQLGMDTDKILAQMDKLVEELDIGHLLDRAPHQLSIGERKKVALSSVLIMEPEILLLDEPTAGLDPLTTRHIIDILLDANRKGATILVSTHDLHIAEELSNIIYVFNYEKKIARSGIPENILSDQDFLMKHNLLHIHSHKHDSQTHAHIHTHVHTSHEEHRH